MRALSLLALLFLPTAIAAEFEQALAPSATEHRARIMKLAGKRDNAVIVPRDAYLAVLEIEQQKAKTEKAKKAVAAIQAEIAAVKEGGLASKDHFPKGLLTARGIYEKGLKEAEFDIEKELKKLNATYLGELNRIPLGQVPNQKLVQQIESEKKAMEIGIVGPIINLETDLIGSRWSVVERPEDIWTFDKEGRLKATWRTSYPSPDQVVVHWNQKASIRLRLSKDGRALLQSGKPKVTLVTDAKE